MANPIFPEKTETAMVCSRRKTVRAHKDLRERLGLLVRLAREAQPVRLARGATGPAGPTGPQGPAAPSALCTWSNTTYSTGAQCLSGPCQSQNPYTTTNSVYMVCQANGAWLATDGGRTGSCPHFCGN